MDIPRDIPGNIPMLARAFIFTWRREEKQHILFLDMLFDTEHQAVLSPVFYLNDYFSIWRTMWTRV